MVLDGKEVAKHNSRESCWVVIKGNVYDVTNFLDDHPGGANIILKYGGKDATYQYEPIHAPGILEETLPPEKCLGPVDPATVQHTEEEKESKVVDIQAIPPIHQVINIDDFEKISQRNASARAWAYYSSAADDELSHAQNTNAFRKVLFRPRVFVDIAECDQSTTLLGLPSTSPIFIAPAALAKLGNPEGEVNLTRGAGIAGIIQAMSTNASNSVEELAAVRVNESQKLWFQLYVNRDRKATEKLLEKVVKSGAFAGIFITVDAPILGKREADERLKQSVMPVLSATSGAGGTMSGSGAKSVTKALATFVAKDLVWEEIAWVRKLTNMPIVLKGIMTVEDAVLAMKYGCQGIYLSNHGGRQLDTSPPAILTLLELQKHCPQVFTKMEVYLDGGVRRGTDVVKALCLGCKAVGLGRPFLYANTCYGVDGVLKAIEIMQEEIDTCMRLLGVTRIDQLGPEYLNTNALDHMIYNPPGYVEKFSQFVKAKL